MMSVGAIFIYKISQCIKDLSFCSAGLASVGLADFSVKLADMSAGTANSADPYAGTGNFADSSGLANLAAPSVVGSVDLFKNNNNRPNEVPSDDEADLDDWRTPLLKYLQDPSTRVDKSIRHSAFKHNDELYRRIVQDLLLECLGSDRARVAMEKSMKIFVVCINRPQR